MRTILFLHMLRCMQPQNMPVISLEFSNNLVELRTCVDTCAALRDVMQYIASYGDLRKEDLRHYVITRNRSCDSGKDDGESEDSFSTPLNSLVIVILLCTFMCATRLSLAAIIM